MYILAKLLKNEGGEKEKRKIVEGGEYR